MRSVLDITPTSNFALASPHERGDQMESLARVLMGLSHPLQLIGQSRETASHPTWPRPPRLERRWMAVVEDDDTGWRARTVANALEGVGLRASGFASSNEGEKPEAIESGAVFDGADWCASLVLRRWPREVAPGWLGNALATDLPVDVGIHLEPQDAAWVARKLKLQQSRHADSDDAADMLTTRDARRVREDLIARKDRPVRVAIAFTVRAATRELLHQRVETLRHEIGLALGDVRPTTFEHDRGLEATSPSGVCNLLGAWHSSNAMSVASTWPFQPATINHVAGADIGTTNGMLVKLDPFDPTLESFGGVVLAKVGMGKSYFLKLLARRLDDVEVIIVEQRTPAEYAGIAGATTVNLADTAYGERAAVLRDYVRSLWALAKADPRPRLLILDELWSLLRDPELAALVEEIARIGRHHYLSLWIATQQVKEMLDSDGGQAVLNNAAIRIYLKQHDHDLDRLSDAVGLSTPARRFLRGAARGQALLDVGGMLVPVDIQATPEEHQAITTDPRERVLVR